MIGTVYNEQRIRGEPVGKRANMSQSNVVCVGGKVAPKESARATFPEIDCDNPIRDGLITPEVCRRTSRVRVKGVLGTPVIDYSCNRRRIKMRSGELGFSHAFKFSFETTTRINEKGRVQCMH